MPKMVVSVWSLVELPEEGTPEFDQLVRQYEDVTGEPAEWTEQYPASHGLAYMLATLNDNGSHEERVCELGSEVRPDQDN
jgi:hypothetical protein